MSAVYRSVKFSNQLGVCSICRDDFKKDDDIVGHAGEGKKHPLHRACAKPWVIPNGTCPDCKIDVDKDSLLPWQEKAKEIGKKMLSGAFWGGGWASGVAGILRSTRYEEFIGVGGLLGLALVHQTNHAVDLTKMTTSLILGKKDGIERVISSIYFKAALAAELGLVAWKVGEFTAVNHPGAERIENGFLNGLQYSIINLPMIALATTASLVLAPKLKSLFLRTFGLDR